MNLKLVQTVWGSPLHFSKKEEETEIKKDNEKIEKRKKGKRPTV